MTERQGRKSLSISCLSSVYRNSKSLRKRVLKTTICHQIICRKSYDYLQDRKSLNYVTPVCPTFELDSSLNIKGQQVVEMETVCVKSVACKPSFVNVLLCRLCNFKVEKILKGSLDSIPSPSPSVKIQIIGRCKGKSLLGVVNKLLKIKSLLTSPSNVLPYYLK